MQIEMDDDSIVIKPEDSQDRSWIQHTLGLKKDGDKVELRRCDVSLGFGKATKMDHLRACKEKESKDGKEK